MTQLAIGPLSANPPVVLAPMAGITNAPFRMLCRRFGGGIYVSEMIGARSLVEGHAKTERLAAFHPDESPRSIQLYGTDPVYMRAAAELLVTEDRVDHIDLNFGCPVPKITRNGGGAALPFKRRRFAAVVGAAVEGAGAGGRHVPVTVKMRMGIDDHHLTYLEAARSAVDVGVSAVALHARTAEQLYSGSARWDAIARLRDEIDGVPVLGNGDIWGADDAVEMMRRTGCDGVVVGRGCLGRPWLFRELDEALTGKPRTPGPTLGEVADIMHDHAAAMAEWFGEDKGVRSFRKHTGWYLKGFPVGNELRVEFTTVTGLDQLDTLLAGLDRDLPHPAHPEEMRRGHTRGPRPVKLPHRWLDDPDDLTGLAPDAELAVSGG